MKAIGYRSSKEDKKQKINIEDIKAIVVYGKDSLVVMTEDGDVRKPYFAKALEVKSPVKFFAKFKAERRGGSPVMSTGVTSVPGARGSASSFRNTYSWSNSRSYNSGLEKVYMYEKAGSTYEITKDNFAEIIKSAFPEDLDLQTRMASKELKFKHLDEIFEKYAK